MIKHARFLFVSGLAILLVVAFMLMRVPSSTKQTTSVSTPSPKVQAIATADPYASWELFRNGYAFPLPADWKNTSDTNGTATFAPGTPIGSIDSLAVTVLSDKRAPQGKRFTTQPEFDQWYAVEGEVQGKIQKLQNLAVDGEKAVMISQKPADDRWMVIVWARHEQVNLYITATGAGEYTVEDGKIVSYIAEHFVFTAPPSTGDDKKE